MYSILLIVHVVIALLVVLVVLLQAGRSGGLSGMFGGGGGGDALFSSSAQQSGLRKVTIILAGVFMATSLGLTFLSSRGKTQTVIQQQFPSLPPLQQPQQEDSPSVPSDTEGTPEAK